MSSEEVVCKGAIGTNEDIVADTQSIPQLNATLDRYPVPDNDVALDQDMGADVALSADLSSRQNDNKLPDFGTFADISGCDIGQMMHEYFPEICFH